MFTTGPYSNRSFCLSNRFPLNYLSHVTTVVRNPLELTQTKLVATCGVPVNMSRMSEQKPRKFNPLESCSAEKARYDSCFKEWYKSKFLKGQIETSSECDERFEELQVCINATLEKAKNGASQSQ